MAPLPLPLVAFTIAPPTLPAGNLEPPANSRTLPNLDTLPTLGMLPNFRRLPKPRPNRTRVARLDDRCSGLTSMVPDGLPSSPRLPSVPGLFAAAGSVGGSVAVGVGAPSSFHYPRSGRRYCLGLARVWSESWRWVYFTMSAECWRMSYIGLYAGGTPNEGGPRWISAQCLR